MRSGWESEQVFHDGNSYFAEVERCISLARRSIEVETYILAKDAFVKKIIDRLTEAVQRGVKVRLLIDGVGSSTWDSASIEALCKTGLEIRVYHPLPWQMHDYGLATFRRIIRRLWVLNRRDHRKTWVFDDEIAFVGGLNLRQGALVWRDSGVKVRGRGVATLKAAFESAWEVSNPSAGWKERMKNVALSAFDPLVRVNYTSRRRRALHRGLIRRILMARDRVWITTPYFVPEFSIMRALRYAAWAGADVRIILPLQSDVFFMRFAAGAFYASLLKAGVRVFEYLPVTLHAKTLLVDGWATVGSSNFNHRSLLHDLEADIVLRNPASLQSLREQFQTDQKASQEVLLETWQRRGWFRRMVEWFLLRFHYWI